jgi:hypothetical protein
MKTRTFSAIPVAVLAIWSTRSIAASELLISGPVDSVDASSNVVTILGHQVHAANSSAVGIGSLVNVYGSIGKGGAISGAVLKDLAKIGSGSDQLYIKGHVTGLSAGIGRFVIGGAVVDYTALLSNSKFRVPMLGDTVVVTGTQPTARGVILGTSVTLAASTAGVVSTGDALGVVSTGDKLGVVSTGDALGVVSTGDKLGVVSTGDALGVVSTGDKLGVVSTGDALGVVSTGDALGVVSTGDKLGVVSTGDALGVVSTGDKLGVVSTGDALGVVSTGDALGVVSTGDALGVVSTGAALGLVAGTSKSQ